MYISILKSLSASCLAAALMAAPALAEEPAAEEAQAEEQGPSDEDFAKSFLGKTYSGELEIDGWIDFGGGLVSPPIFVHHYGREDNTSLVVTSKEVAPATSTSPPSYVVTDALIVSKPWKGYALSTACTKGEDYTLRYIGEARGTEDKEWWTEVRRAWEIELPPKEPEAEDEAKPEPGTEAEADAKPKPTPGKIKKADTRGVKCSNPLW